MLELKKENIFTMIQLLNCSNLSICSLLGKPFESSFINNYYRANLTVSSITVIMTFISAFMFTVYIKLDTVFLKILHLYSLNSLFLLLNDFIMALTYLIIDPVNYVIAGRSYINIYWMKWHNVYVYTNLRQIFFLFGSILEIFLVYERIRIYDPRWKFIKNMSNTMLYGIILLISFTINLPVNMSREVGINKYYLLDTDSLQEGYIAAERDFEHQEILKGFIFACSIIRSIVTLFLEIGFTAILIYTLNVFWKQKIVSQTINREKTIVFKAKERSNLKICFTHCIISIMYHSLNFGTFLAKEFDSTPGRKYFQMIGIAGAFGVHLKYTLSFIIFYVFNKKFKTAFIKMFTQRSRN